VFKSLSNESEELLREELAPEENDNELPPDSENVGSGSAVDKENLRAET
jgi:hypothetical protein